MAAPRLTLTEHPSDEDEKAVGDALDRFNQRHTGAVHARPLAVLINAPESDKVVGGLIGRTSLGLLFVDLLFVPDELRGQGIGVRLMNQAEDEAIRRGCRQSVLYTIAFQAPEFYRRLGYREFGRTDSDPPEYARIYMKKDLGVKHEG
jgi:GNAT superfamily N-acetyltransferase